ncbi:MAG: hypothetical protein Q8R76_10055 [Candidatus Omnitrophota bacterium]|nr:hypothetical protein [Candidatus Omnitrophota bacterium]
MKQSNPNDLLEGLSQHGYPLLRRGAAQPPEQLLKQLLEQDDMRLLEGFPVVLANAMRGKSVQSVDQRDVDKRAGELEFELLLSALFTPRQKSLLKKKMAGQPLSKTEREYFSRVVKKRLKALANEELHQLAKKLAA